MVYLSKRFNQISNSLLNVFVSIKYVNVISFEILLLFNNY